MKHTHHSRPMLARWLSTLARWRRSSLLIDSTIKVFFVGLGLAFVFTLATMLFIRNNETDRLMKQVGEIITTVESAVRVACFVGDTTLATDIAKGLLTNQLISSVKITNNQLVLANETRPGKTNKTISKNYIVRKHVSSPFGTKENVGEIEITANREFIQAQALNYSIMSSIVLVLEATLVAWAVALVLLLAVVRPIQILSKRTDAIQIESGEHIEPPDGNANNEIGRLTRHFNQVLDKMGTLLASEKIMLEALKLKEQNFRTLAENSPDVIIRYDRNYRRTFVNPVYLRETGLTLERALNSSIDEVDLWQPTMPLEEYRKRLQQVLETGTSDQILLTWARPDGQLIHFEMHVVAEHQADGQVCGALAIGRDITQRKALEQQLFTQASYDSLTGLPNRRMFSERLREEVAKAIRNKKNVVLLFIDLDEFKQVNDTLGHEIGDELLINVAQRIRDCVRESDTAARLGGDEFVLILPDIDDINHVKRIAQAIIDSMEQPFNFKNGTTAHISASIGIASFPNDANTPDDLVRCADKAMYTAKGLGRNGFSFYTLSS